MPDARVSASVVIPAFTFDRWDRIVRGVEAVQAQTRRPAELILSIDRNLELLRACEDRWGSANLPVPVRPLPNRNNWSPRVATETNSDGVARGYGGGSARNSGADAAVGEIIVTFDDDAWPEPDCLEHLLAPYDNDPLVYAVGGCPLPEFETSRPVWFPRTFDWIFGCAYEGLPTELAETPRLIGAVMSFRADIFREMGGFKAVDFDDLDVCTRLAYYYPEAKILYEPRAIGHHWVPAKRVSWNYFWTRSFLVNRDKVAAFATMGDGASLSAERAFVLKAIRSHATAAARGLGAGDLAEAKQLAAMLLGVGLAGGGNIAGRFRQRREARRAKFVVGASS